jgi:hypothetical protein
VKLACGKQAVPDVKQQQWLTLESNYNGAELRRAGEPAVRCGIPSNSYGLGLLRVL